MPDERDLEAAQRSAALLVAGLVVLDLETTSERSDPNVGIVQVGILHQDGQVLLDTKVNPEREVADVAERIHGIDESDLSGAPTFVQVYPKLAACLNGKQVATYNTDADRQVLATVCRNHALAAIEPAEWVDVMDLYSRYRQLDRAPRLVEACQAEGIEIIDAHSAIGDCRLALELLRRIAAGARG